MAGYDRTHIPGAPSGPEWGRSMVESATIITAAGVGLKLVDQFRDLVLRWRGSKAEPPSAVVVQRPGSLDIEYKHKAQPPQKIAANQVKLDGGEETRYRALDSRVHSNWKYFNDLYAQLPLLSADESVRIKLRMEKSKEELCTDFREMVRIYERFPGPSSTTPVGIASPC